MKNRVNAFCVQETIMNSLRAAQTFARRVQLVSIQLQGASEKLHASTDHLACLMITMLNSLNAIQKIIESKRLNQFNHKFAREHIQKHTNSKLQWKHKSAAKDVDEVNIEMMQTHASSVVKGFIKKSIIQMQKQQR